MNDVAATVSPSFRCDGVGAILRRSLHQQADLPAEPFEQCTTYPTPAFAFRRPCPLLLSVSPVSSCCLTLRRAVGRDGRVARRESQRGLERLERIDRESGGGHDGRAAVDAAVMVKATRRSTHSVRGNQEALRTTSRCLFSGLTETQRRDAMEGGKRTIAGDR